MNFCDKAHFVFFFKTQTKLFMAFQNKNFSLFTQLVFTTNEIVLSCLYKLSFHKKKLSTAAKLTQRR